MVNQILTGPNGSRALARHGPLAARPSAIPPAAQGAGIKLHARLAKSAAPALCRGRWRFKNSGSAAFGHPASLSHDPAEVLPQETVGRGRSAAADAFFKDDRNAPAAAKAVRARFRRRNKLRAALVGVASYP